MNERALLKKTISQAKDGDKEAFENFYILTVQDTYGKICSGIRDSRDAEELLVDTYVMLYRRVYDLPLGEEALSERISDEICRLAYKKFGIELHGLYDKEEHMSLTEDKAATLWLRIEEKTGLNREIVHEEESSTASYVYSIGKILLTVFILIAVVFVLYNSIRWFSEKRSKNDTSDLVITQEETTSAVMNEIVIKEDLMTPGWEQKPDGNLYYVKKNGMLADSAIAIGKQILTFSVKGELTLIGNNPQVSEDPDLSFDEMIRYEVKNGDIYKKDLETDGEEICVVRNGHVVQADVRGGFLWYISRYQVPNSNQIKTTIYKADLNGEKQEELYTTDATLTTEQFQMTSEWMYYLSDGMLLRKNLETEGVELMAEGVEYYYAWENTAYYMNGRTLEHVSQGVDYSGIEAGYKIELQENGLILLDVTGQVVIPDENGEKQVGDRYYKIENGVITAVRPANRESGGITYYVDTAGHDKKIYSRNSTGVQGLIRQEGLAVDSLCIAGEWLYYSARIAEYGGEIESRIYRINLQTTELEEVGDMYRGYMRNLYYFDNQQMIYGELIPSVADPDSIHGEIAMIPIGGEPQDINDTASRPVSDGSDMYEMVMAGDSSIYCLYHQFDYNSETGEMEWLTTQPIEIKLDGSGV